MVPLIGEDETPRVAGIVSHLETAAPDEVSELMTTLAGRRRIVGFDVTELAPDLGPEACAQAAAKLTYRVIGLALAPEA